MKQRYLEVDILKIFTCICVIAIHISAPLVAEGNPWVVAVNGFTRFVVPCFVFASGLILMVIYKEQKISYFKFQLKRLKSIVIPYLFWALFCYRGSIKAMILGLPYQDLVEGILWGYAGYHLYYIVIIIQLYLLFPLIKTIFAKLNPLVALGLVVVYQGAYTYLMPYLMGEFEFFSLRFDRLFTGYLSFFLVGVIIGGNYEKITLALRTKGALVIGLTGLAYGLSYIAFMAAPLGLGSPNFIDLVTTPYNWVIYSTISSVLIFMVAYKVSLKVKAFRANSAWIKSIELLSGASFYVYLGHPLLISIIDKLYIKYGMVTPSQAIFGGTFVVALVSFALALLYIKGKGKVMEATRG